GAREVTLQMISRARLTATAEAALMTEVATIWRAAGVGVEWRPAPSGETAVAGEGVYVMVVPEAEGLSSDPNGGGHGLALIRFSGGRAPRHIYASVGAPARGVGGNSRRSRPRPAPGPPRHRRDARAPCP